MTDDVVAAADQLLAGEAADGHEGVIGVGDDALEVGTRNKVGIGRKGNFALGDRLVVFHRVSLPEIVIVLIYKKYDK
jgi:hypothetical protein